MPASNRFDTSFLRMVSMIPDYRDRIVLLRNSFTEHGDLDPDKAHVNVLARFLHAIDCPEVSIHVEDFSCTIGELSVKRFTVELDEPVVGPLARFLAFETVTPLLFARYYRGLPKIFPKLSARDMEYFLLHIDADPTHEIELLDVIGHHVHGPDDLVVLTNNYELMLSRLKGFLDYEHVHLPKMASQYLARYRG
ncbi:iron-containing redox enzyme family protein [Trinickia caryophylli]|nr:iron-containing redox enzyme family protein [Trinickia caryophylli]